MPATTVETLQKQEAALKQALAGAETPDAKKLRETRKKLRRVQRKRRRLARHSPKRLPSRLQKDCCET